MEVTNMTDNMMNVILLFSVILLSGHSALIEQATGAIESLTQPSWGDLFLNIKQFTEIIDGIAEVLPIAYSYRYLLTHFWSYIHMQKFYGVCYQE